MSRYPRGVGKQEDRPIQLSWRETAHQFIPFGLKLHGGGYLIGGLLWLDPLPAVIGAVLLAAGFWLRWRWP